MYYYNNNVLITNHNFIIYLSYLLKYENNCRERYFDFYLHLLPLLFPPEHITTNSNGIIIKIQKGSTLLVSLCDESSL